MSERVPLPELVGVYGGGRMGGGIAHAFALAGAQVVVVESNDAAAQHARVRIQESLDRSARNGVEVRGSVDVVTDPSALATAGLVVEAVPEMLAVKHEVLARIAAVAPHAAIGTNTSSIPLRALAAALTDATGLIGLHFFNPVPVSDLVEIVVGESTAPSLVEDARAWVRALGKQSIVVRDAPGFASSRLGVLLAMEAIRMLEEGVATAEDIDTAMTLGYRHPVGPLRTTDLVGLDVRLAIAEHLERELGPRFAPPSLLRAKVEARELGRKVGRGFFEW